MTASERRKHSIYKRAKRAIRDIDSIILSMNKAWERAQGDKNMYIISQAIGLLLETKNHIETIERLHKP